MKLSKVIVAALAISALLPSAKGQVAIGTLGMPTYITTGIKIGTAPDGTQYKTALWLINASAGDWSYTSMAPIDLTATNLTTGQATGWAVDVGGTYANGSDATAAFWNGGPNMNGAERIIVTGYPDNTASVRTLNIQLWSAYGYAITALVEHFDASGTNLLEPPVALTDSQLLVPGVSTHFTMALDNPAMMEVVIQNTTNSVANVTFGVYDSNPSSTNRIPFATTTVQVPAGAMFCRRVSEIFADNTSFASDYAGPDGGNGTGFAQAVLTVSSDQPVSVNPILFSTKSDGSLLSTVWYAFPSDPPTAKLASVYGFNPTGNAWTKSSATAGTYLILFGAFAASGNGVAIDGSVLPAAAVIYQSTGQINVALGNVPLTAGNHSIIVAANGGASAPMWFTVVTQ
jgi:hypothetical protein